MTEEEWLACNNFAPMHTFLQGKVSQRKWHLFACACCRTQEDVLEDVEIRKALAAAERYIDGLIVHSTVMNWHRRASAARGRISNAHIRQWLAYQAVSETVCSKYYGSWRFTHESIARGIAEESGHVWGTPDWLAAREKALRGMIPLLRDIVGNPFRRVSIAPGWLAWNGGLVRKLAEGIHHDRAYDRLPVLGDALEESGCDNDDILAHCRSTGPHVRGCWVIDLILGKS